MQLPHPCMLFLSFFHSLSLFPFCRPWKASEHLSGLRCDFKMPPCLLLGGRKITSWQSSAEAFHCQPGDAGCRAEPARQVPGRLRLLVFQMIYGCFRRRAQPRCLPDKIHRGRLWTSRAGVKMSFVNLASISSRWGRGGCSVPVPAKGCGASRARAEDAASMDTPKKASQQQETGAGEAVKQWGGTNT